MGMHIHFYHSLYPKPLSEKNIPSQYSPSFGMVLDSFEYSGFDESELQNLKMVATAREKFASIAKTPVGTYFLLDYYKKMPKGLDPKEVKKAFDAVISDTIRNDGKFNPSSACVSDCFINNKFNKELYNFLFRCYEFEPLEYSNIKKYLRESIMDSGRKGPKVSHNAVDSFWKVYEKTRRQDLKSVATLISSAKDGVTNKKFNTKILEHIEQDWNYDLISTAHVSKLIDVSKSYDKKIFWESKYNLVRFTLSKFLIKKYAPLEQACELTKDYINAVSNSDTGMLDSKLVKGADLLQNSVPLPKVAIILPLCIDVNKNFNQTNFNEYVRYNSACKQICADIDGIQHHLIKDLEHCKDANGLIISKGVDALIKIRSNYGFDENSHVDSITRHCVKNGKVNNKLLRNYLKMFNLCQPVDDVDLKNITRLMQHEFIAYDRHKRLDSSVDAYARMYEKYNKVGLFPKDPSYLVEASFDKNEIFDVETFDRNRRILGKVLKNIDTKQKNLIQKSYDKKTIEELFETNCFSVDYVTTLVGEDYLPDLLEFYNVSQTARYSEIFDFIYRLPIYSLSEDMLAMFYEKTNPVNTPKYKSLKDELSYEKFLLHTLKTPDFLRFEKEICDNIESLNDSVKVAKKNKNLEDVKRYQLKIKELRLALNSLKTPEIREQEMLINQISAQIREMISQRIKTPEEMLSILEIISVFDTDEMNEVIPYMSQVTPEQKDMFCEIINKKIFKMLKIPYSKDISEKLDFYNNSYLKELLLATPIFYENLREVINLFISNPNKDISQTFDELPQNRLTAQLFKDNGINYKKWSEFDPNSYISFDTKIDLDTARFQLIKNLEDDCSNLWLIFKSAESSEIKDSIENIYNKLKNENFDIETCAPWHIYKDDQKITEIDDVKRVVDIIKTEFQEYPNIWSNIEPRDSVSEFISTFYNHINDMRSKEIEILKSNTGAFMRQITIRKADMNNIGHSLFLGNHAHCCTSVGTGSNQWSAPNYIKNKLVSCIEILDGDTPIGNTMCFIANIDGEPSLYLDNIELDAKYQNNNRIRDGIFEYAKILCRDIGKPDMNIYAGPYRHKVNMPEDMSTYGEISILGNSGGDKIYLDYMTRGDVIDGTQSRFVDLYKIS